MVDTKVEDQGPEPETEVWTFGGSRVLNGKRVHAWVPPGRSHKDVYLFKANGSFAVGSEYEVKVIRKGDNVTKVGTPAYLERSDDDGLRAILEASHRAAEVTLGRLALERNDRRRSALDEALAPAIKLLKEVPYTQRDAFMVYIISKFYSI